MQIFSFSPFGYEGALVAVEVDLRRGIPAVDMVGLADGAVKESRERMRAAIQNSGFEFPSERVLISLSPADLRKEGAGFDLAVALAVLEANRERTGALAGGGISAGALAGASHLVRANHSAKAGEQNNANALADDFAATDEFSSGEKISVQAGTSYGYSGEGEAVLVMGELELSGNVRGVRGVHAAASTAAASGIRKCIVPSVNADEAREVNGMCVYGAATLADAFTALSLPDLFSAADVRTQNAFVPSDCVEIDGVLFPPVLPEFSFDEISGQRFLVRGLQIAAAGGHNVIAVGAPGCGKTMALQKFPALLPLLTVEEAQPVTRIYSLAGILSQGEPLMRVPPFRMPHQTATIEGMCGGGIHCTPGEISLAHNGALFLDEASEFRSSVLQMLRVPLESGHVTLARAGRSTVYPASFQLLIAANPCPCGNYGLKSKLCVCSTRNRELYWKKFSAPLLDRIDIRISVDNELAETDAPRLSEMQNAPSTETLRIEIARAVKIQRARQKCRNAKLTSGECAEICKMTCDAQTALEKAARRFGFSPRAISSCLKISRTIADMAGAEIIDTEHMKEAVLYRKSCDFIPSES